MLAFRWKRIHLVVKLHEDLLILDGMPRNVRRVEMIREHLEIHRLIYLKCSDEEDMIHRIGQSSDSRKSYGRCR